MEKWSEGIYLLGLYGAMRTGSWLLIHDREAAILEIPPCLPNQSICKPVLQYCDAFGVKVKYILSSHCHMDHTSIDTLRKAFKMFPKSTLHVHKRFRKYLRTDKKVKYFSDFLNLSLGGEVIYLNHAPKHSSTDTIIIFRGVAFTGDWELNTLRSVHDGKHYSVSKELKLASIDKMSNFEKEHNYHIHKIFSAHANDRRENINFKEIMEDTRIDRQLW